MIVSAFTTDDPRVAISHAMPDAEREELTGVDCVADINVNSAFIDFHDSQDRERPHRPYMHMICECVGLHGDLPYGVKGLQFPEDKGIPVDIFYEFTDDQLANLVSKGLYSPDFRCPDILFESELYMPVYCDMTMVPPQGEDVPPIIFANIEDRGSIEVTAEECGYDFAEFFEKPVPHHEEENYLEDFDMGADYDAQYDAEHQEPKPEKPRELTPEELALHDEYEGIHQNVVKFHVEPHDEHLAKSIAEAEAEKNGEKVAEDSAEDSVEDVAEKPVEKSEEAEPAKSIVDEPFDASMFDDDDQDDDDTFVDMNDDDVIEDSDRTSGSDVKTEQSAVVHREAVKQNVEENLEDEVPDMDGDGDIDENDVEAAEDGKAPAEPKHAKPVDKAKPARPIPAEFQSIADEERQMREDEASSSNDYTDD